MARAGGAFTLIELLVVIYIIGILAALITGLTSASAPAKVRNRVSVELQGHRNAIEAYHKKYGFYPPDNPKSDALPPLYYELTGSNMPPAVATAMGLKGIANTELNDRNQPFNFHPGLKPTGVAKDPSSSAYYLVVPYAGPSGAFNTWHYRSSKPEHNTEDYDLWADVVVGGKNFTISNWKE